MSIQILVIEGLHPFYDERVRDLCDFKLYLDISDDVKFAWKLQRDSQERGHSVESIKQSIESRKPDFDAYIDPQKKHADIILQVGHTVVTSKHFLQPCQAYVTLNMASTACSGYYRLMVLQILKTCTVARHAEGSVITSWASMCCTASWQSTAAWHISCCLS